MFFKRISLLSALILVPLACTPERNFDIEGSGGTGKGGADEQGAVTGGAGQGGDAGAAACGERDCTSGRDNDCNGRADRDESACTACPLGVTQDCEGEGAGVCRDGLRTCLLSKDRSTVRWSECAPLVAAGDRDCTSELDYNCNGEADSSEEECRSCDVDTEAPCNTGRPGICGPGMSACQLDSETNTTTWGTCEQSVDATARDCTSSDDNDCNGTADDKEAQCSVCSVGESQACGTHPQDGVGTCKAGTQTCVTSDPTERIFGSCTGSVGPTTEACGPTQADTDCDGTVGNGSGCTVSVQIWSTTTSCNADTIAATTAPGGSYDELLSTLELFKSSLPGTTPVHNCTSTWTVYTSTIVEKYVRFGSCQAGDVSNGIVGYLSTSKATGYDTLKKTEWKRGRQSGTYTVTDVPLLDCPAGCTCTAASVHQP